jgi:hypothetical protein
MPAFCFVVAVLVRGLGDFSLHPQGRPCGRPPAAAVLGRHPHGDRGGTPQCLSLATLRPSSNRISVDNDAELLMESAT